MVRMTDRFLTLSLAFCAATALSFAQTAMAQNAPGQKQSQQLANPASENCIRQGGSLVILKHGDGGEYGVCVFADNRQCEEWAMFRGDCPVGGIAVAGYRTPAARYCGITGGNYQARGNNKTGEEQGTCSFRNGRSCDAWDYFAGKCNPNADTAQSSYHDPFAYCAAVGTIDAPDGRYKGARMPDSLIQGMIRQGIVSADAPPEFRENAVWRCMNHSLWVCHFGANIPCLEKADMEQAPTSAMKDYCQANPSAEIIPAAVTGRATVYEWVCHRGKAKAIKEILTTDPQGYLAEFWYKLNP
ncbi:MAG: DUF333 domain-containing protein [Thermodesulfovibrionales bacterium]|jgi:hypothetical protein